MARPLTRALMLSVLLLGVMPHALSLSELQEGMRAPDFVLSDLAGNQVSLADTRSGSELVIVTFVATWSVNSKEVLERLAHLTRQYGREQLAVLALSVERQDISPADEQALEELAAALGLSFPILLDRGLQTFHDYGVVAVPTTLIIDRSGTIAGELAGYPLALREGFFDLIATALGGEKARTGRASQAYVPDARSIRYYNLARALMEKGSVDMAEVNLKKAVEADERFALPELLLGQLYASQAANDESVEYQGQTYRTVHLTAEARQAMLTEATERFRQALEKDPRNAAALTELAKVKIRQGDLEGAEQFLKDALASEPSFGPAHCLTGQLWLRRGNLDAAEHAFAEATGLNPFDYRCYLAYARVQEEAGELERALALYRTSLKLLWQSNGRPVPASLFREEP